MGSLRGLWRKMIKRVFKPASGNTHEKNFLRSIIRWSMWLAAPLLASLTVFEAQIPASNAQSLQRTPELKSYPQALVQSGDALFQQNCSFCHGRNAGGGA